MGMIDVGDKPDSLRIAVAQALLSFDINIMSTIKDGNSPKGNIFEIAKVAALPAERNVHVNAERSAGAWWLF